MIYVISAVVGAGYGFAAGLLKYVLLWRKVIRPNENAEEVKTAGIFIRMGLSYVINVLILLVVFLLKDILPFDFTVAIIAAATGLVISGKVFSTKRFSGYLMAQGSQNTR